MDIDDMDMENIESNQQDQEAVIIDFFLFSLQVDIDDIDNNAEDSNNIFASNKYIVKNEHEDTVHKVRTYDLSITYDFYY